jgi:hypothetical protein
VQRTEGDLLQLETVGHCRGIENYARHLAARAAGAPPDCLVDYFPADPPPNATTAAAAAAARKDGETGEAGGGDGGWLLLVRTPPSHRPSCPPLPTSLSSSDLQLRSTIDSSTAVDLPRIRSPAPVAVLI